MPGGPVQATLAHETEGGNDAAEGDFYETIERVLGSNRGDDRLSGNALAQTLAGGGGEDVLRGFNGDDAFEYFKPSDGGDRIDDFHSTLGDGDGFLVHAAGFGAGLEDGVLEAGRFRVRSDNRARDGNDRFIFRTTDETLWFDRDGDRDANPVLVADLQDGAVLFLEQILIV